jgi:hypothetical protein
VILCLNSLPTEFVDKLQQNTTFDYSLVNYNKRQSFALLDRLSNYFEIELKVFDANNRSRSDYLVSLAT